MLSMPWIRGMFWWEANPRRAFSFNGFHVVPLFKGGDKNDPSCYRPISLLPALGKLLEKVVSTQIVDYLNENNLISSKQYGFREGFSTELAVLDIYEKLKIKSFFFFFSHEFSCVFFYCTFFEMTSWCCNTFLSFSVIISFIFLPLYRWIICNCEIKILKCM